jgi:hypothetical protein
MHDVHNRVHISEHALETPGSDPSGKDPSM